MTGVDTGRRPEAARLAAPSSSANRYGVMNDTATRPTPPALAAPKPPDASSRRVATPTWFDGTTTVTGASGSVALAATMWVRKASTAARPYGTHSTRRPITSIVGTSGRGQGR